jgi:uncharacterized delta-60 repeat protein
MTKRSAVILLLAVGLALGQAVPAMAAAGDLDTTFSGDGKVATNFTSGDDFAWDVAIQSDGKIVAAGRTPDRFALVRYNADGTLDTSFSGDGKVTSYFTSGVDAATSVAIQSDGKIVAAGRAAGSGGRFAIARYTTGGRLDATFDGDGKKTTNFTTGEDLARDVAIQSDSKIVAAGRAGGSGGRFALVRYNSNGSLDTSFSGDGKLTTNFTTGDDWANEVAIQPDGKIVAAGRAGGSGGRFALVRYNSNGSLDTSFSGDGKLTTDFTAGSDIATSVAIQPDGKIVAAGRSGGSGGRFALARYSSNGSLDTSFNGVGKKTTNFTSGEDFAWDVAIQADGRIVAAGTAAAGFHFALTRYNDDGSLDASFGTSGKLTTDFTSGIDVATGVAIQADDGNIVAAGRVGGSGGRFGVARYLST